MKFQRIVNATREFLAEEDGPTAVEYAVMLGLILAVCVAAVTFMGARNQESFEETGAAISGAFGN